MCADLRDTAAWEEFIRRFQPAIYSAILRTGRHYPQFNPGACDDLVQETYVRLSAARAKALREFVPRHPGSAFGYVQVIAIRVTQDHCKKKQFHEELPPDAPDPAAPGKTEWLALVAEIDRPLRTLAGERDRQIFRLHHIQGMTAREIAAIPVMGLTVEGVESVLVRLKRLLREYFADSKRE